MRYRRKTIAPKRVSDWFPANANTRMPEDNTNFVLLVDTAATGATTTVTLPLAGTVNCIVDWGDDLSDTYTTAGNKTHTYAVGGKYTIRIRGVLTGFGTFTAKPWLVGSPSFGQTGLTSLSVGFWTSRNLVEAPKYLPLGITNLSTCFANSGEFNGDVSRWYTGTVTNMSDTFGTSAKFNQNVGAWDTSNVTNMASMFGMASGTGVFNQDIGNWDTRKVTTMNYMFGRQIAFNQNIGAWDTSSVTNMGTMFDNNLAFNGDISTWDTGNVTNMAGMFTQANSFNQPIGSWNTSKVTSMASMFARATFGGAFNQDISTWDVGSVTTMANMFSIGPTPFQQNLGPWRPSKCASFVNFLNQKNLTTVNYDGLLTGWTDFTGTGWNSGSITSFADPGGGQVTVNTSAAHGYANNHVMRITGTTNYDGSYVISNVASTSFSITATFVATETGTWNATLQSGVTFNGGGSKYSVGAATTARGVLTGAPYNWTITDGGQA
jgi:surface protein